MVTLVIMDGFGIRKQKKGNAVLAQGTPFLDKLKNKYPTATISASGQAVGLARGQMGNSEAGHLTIGAGRRFYQPLERINQALHNGSFFENKELLKVMQFVQNSGGALHIVGLLSDGGIHSHINHIKAVITMCHNFGLQRVFLHAILDGRDTGMTSGVNFVAQMQKFCKQQNTKIKTIIGRAWAMDREEFFDRTQKAYRAIVQGQADVCSNNPVASVKASYANGVTDEFVEPITIGTPQPITNLDGIIFCNIRKDRMRQLVDAITSANFDKFATVPLGGVAACGLVEYDDDFKRVGVAFPEQPLENGLAQCLSQHKIRQLRVAETSKFPHITYYFNCGRDKPYAHEKRKKIDGFGDLEFSQRPEMRTRDVTATVIDGIASKKFDFVAVNLPNCDMVGHSGNFEATKKAVKVVDECAYQIAMATLNAGGHCIITADHGNAEEMLDKFGKVKVSHTTNKVPFILVSNTQAQLCKSGELGNIAPTILDLFGLDIPPQMLGSLILKNQKQ